MYNISSFDLDNGFTPSIYASLVHTVKDYKLTSTINLAEKEEI